MRWLSCCFGIRRIVVGRLLSSKNSNYNDNPHDSKRQYVSEIESENIRKEPLESLVQREHEGVQPNYEGCTNDDNFFCI